DPAPRTSSLLPSTTLFRSVGLIPGWGGTQRLTRIVGPSQAAEMICSGDPIKPNRARELGLAFDAVPSEKLLAEARRLLAWSRQSDRKSTRLNSSHQIISYA